MRKMIVVLLAGFAVVIVTAAPALALKDPFEPLIDPETATETGTGTTAGTETSTEPTLTTNENPFSENMPNTGADTFSWLVLGYVLVVIGGAFLVLAWARRAGPGRRQLFRP